MAETTKKKTTTNKALDYLKLLQSEQSRLNKILKNAIDVDDANFTFRRERKLKGRDALKLKKNEKMIKVVLRMVKIRKKDTIKKQKTTKRALKRT